MTKEIFKTKRAKLEEMIVSLFFKATKAAIEQEKLHNLSTYQDFFYLMDKAIVNPSLRSKAIILNNHIDTYRLGDDLLSDSLAVLAKYEEIKKELVKLKPTNRGFTPNKNYARLFVSKERDEIESLIR